MAIPTEGRTAIARALLDEAFERPKYRQAIAHHSLLSDQRPQASALRWLEPRVAYLRKHGLALAPSILQRALWSVVGLELGAWLVLRG